MSTSLSPSNKCNTVTCRNNTKNNDSDRDSGGDRGGDNGGVKKAYSTKITHTQDEPGTLVNYGTTTQYISSGLRLSD